MSSARSIEPYVPGTIPFSQYLEKLEWVFAHQMLTHPEDQKISFLASCTTEVYGELKLLFPRRDLKEVAFREITEALRTRYDKTESVLKQRYKFYQRVQEHNESPESFIQAVKLLAAMCNFGEYRDMAIRDRLVCGIGNNELRQYLFDEDNLTLGKAEQLILNGAPMPPIGAKPNPQTSETKICTFCGKQGHNRNSCYDLYVEKMERAPENKPKRDVNARDWQQHLLEEEYRALAQAERMLYDREMAARANHLPEDPMVVRGYPRGMPMERWQGRSRSPPGSFERRPRSQVRPQPLVCDFCRRPGHVRQQCFQLKKKKP